MNKFKKDYIEYIYKSDLTVLINYSQKKTKKYFLNNYKFIPEQLTVQNDAFSLHMVKETGESKFIIWLERYDINVLVHELLHFTFQVLGDRGIKYCEESEEAFTYFLQGIFKRVTEDYQELGNKPQKEIL